MSNTYIAKWPDKSITVLNAENEIDLFWWLDHEDNPLSAEVYILPKKFVLTTKVYNNEIEFFEIFKDMKLKRFNFSEDIIEKVYNE